VRETNALIIGASISGLACAASLQKENVDYIIIEKQDKVGSPWRNHYERLHLHTNKRISNLPFKKFGKEIPQYPSRQDVIDYLEDYRAAFNINPLFSTNALTTKREDDHWITNTNNGVIRSKYLIISTGVFHTPKSISLKGMQSFTGKILHSSRYKSGKDYKGQSVLVIGFGNSACEIAIDLYEQGASVYMSVRSPVNVIPRALLGIPILELSLLLNRLPARLADTVSSPLIRWSIGDITKLGLKKMSYGPLEQVRKDGHAPVLDIGTIRHIKEGHIRIFNEIDHIQENLVYFKNGEKEKIDAIIAGIGYETNFIEIANVDKKRFDDLRIPVDHQKYFGDDGLYFCGFWISPTGQIREISLDAKKIAKDIARKER